MILLLKVKQIFKNVFMITRLKYFHDSLNIAVIKWKKSNDGHFPSGAVIIHFWDKLMKKYIFKVMEMPKYYVNKKKWSQTCHMLSHDPFNFVSLYLFFLTFAIKLKDANYKNYWNVLTFLWPMKNGVRFEYVPWKSIWFCFVSIATIFGLSFTVCA